MTMALRQPLHTHTAAPLRGATASRLQGQRASARPGWTPSRGPGRVNATWQPFPPQDRGATAARSSTTAEPVVVFPEVDLPNQPEASTRSTPFGAAATASLNKVELENSQDLVRQQAVLTAAAVWIARIKANEALATAEAQQTPETVAASASDENSSPETSEINGNSFVEDPHPCEIHDVEFQKGCSVGVFLVRSDGISCTRDKVENGKFMSKHPSTQQQLIMWDEAPRKVLVLKKLGKTLLPEVIEAVKMLNDQGNVTILVEQQVLGEVAECVQDTEKWGLPSDFMRNMQGHITGLPTDLVLCLGGDGVILHASHLFQGPCPPILGINLGSMGFLAPHTFAGLRGSMEEAMMLKHPDYEEKLKRGNLSPCDGVPITLRMRLHCELWEDGKQIPGSETFEVLNELVIDRGPSSFLSMIECYELTSDGQFRLLTKVQADGLILSTPTGSTAYSVSAGGSMVHPSVPCILLTPICPHSLSFRPVILPDSAKLLLRVPDDARSTAWVCFDGRRRQEVKRGVGIMVRMSEYPVPTVNWGDHMSEFIGSLVRCLNWNDREEQKPLEVAPEVKYTKFQAATSQKEKA